MKRAIYKITGTTAALIEEKVWDQLLRGKIVGVWEPSNERYTLLADGNTVDSFGGTSLTDALETVKLSVKFLNGKLWEPKGGSMFAHAKNSLFELRPGYPTMLTCTKAQRDKHERAGRTDAKKISEYYRGLMHAGTNAMLLAEEMSAHGTVKEGKD